MADDWGGEGGHGGGGAAADETPDGSEEVMRVFSHTIASVVIKMWTCKTYAKVRIGNEYLYFKAPDINKLVEGVDAFKNRVLGFRIPGL